MPKFKIWEEGNPEGSQQHEEGAWESALSLAEFFAEDLTDCVDIEDDEITLVVQDETGATTKFTADAQTGRYVTEIEA